MFDPQFFSATGRNARFNQFKNRASFVKKNVKQVDKQEEWGSKSEVNKSILSVTTLLFSIV